MVKSPAPAPAPVPTLGTVDRDRVDRLRRIGYLLDNSIPIPGTGYRVGLEAIIGLVPGLGDLVRLPGKIRRSVPVRRKAHHG